MTTCAALDHSQISKNHQKSQFGSHSMICTHSLPIFKCLNLPFPDKLFYSNSRLKSSAIQLFIQICMSAIKWLHASKGDVSLLAQCDDMPLPISSLLSRNHGEKIVQRKPDNNGRSMGPTDYLVHLLRSRDS